MICTVIIFFSIFSFCYKSDKTFVVKSLYDTSDIIYMHVEQPKELNYIYKLYKAKFSDSFEQELFPIKTLLIKSQPENGCTPFSNEHYIKNNVAFIVRGNCTFVTKAIMSQKAGALAMIVYDLSQNMVITMAHDETNRTVKIPSMFMIYEDGKTISSVMSMQNLSRISVELPFNVSGIPTYLQKLTPWSLW